MAIIIGGVNIPNNGDFIKYGGTNLTKVNVKIGSAAAVTVWEKQVFDTKEFGFSSAIRSFEVPISGLYKLEAWGAVGGYAAVDPNTAWVNINLGGGYGGYAATYMGLYKGTVLYIVTGGSGRNMTLYRRGWNDYYTIGNLNNGYNGGINGGCYSHVDHVSYVEHYWVCGGGGGASHIATRSGLLEDLSGYQDDILVVAGGGGGGLYSAEPQENGGDDKYVQWVGGPGGGSGDGSGFGKNSANLAGSGGGWTPGMSATNGYIHTTGGSNMSRSISWNNKPSPSAISQSGVNPGSGKVKITFVSA